MFKCLQKVPHPSQDRTMVVACLAEVAQEMGAPISTYVDVRKLHVLCNNILHIVCIFVDFMNDTIAQRVMPLILKELGSSEATNRRNAAFCVGEFCKNGGAATLKYPFVPFPFSNYIYIF